MADVDLAFHFDDEHAPGARGVCFYEHNCLQQGNLILGQGVLCPRKSCSQTGQTVSRFGKL